MRLENIYFDLFYGSLDALQLWAVMCLIDNGEEKGEALREMELWRQSARGWVMPLFDNDDPLVQKCAPQS